LSEKKHFELWDKAALYDKNEADNGSQKSAADSEEKKIFEIMGNYRNDQGDYIFIIAKKD